MNILIIGKNYRGTPMTIASGQEELVSKKAMELQKSGIEEIQVMELMERNVTDQFVLRYNESNGLKMFMGSGNQPSFVSKYHLKTRLRNPLLLITLCRHR